LKSIPLEMFYSRTPSQQSSESFVNKKVCNCEKVVIS
jgi:hypothetical protein